MRTRFPMAIWIVTLLLLAGTILGLVITQDLSRASETGTLKLKAKSCAGSGDWLSNATVDVIIYRPGTGQIDSDSGSTNSVGYVEFTFGGLEESDEARVTVTPSGGSPDSHHTYYWHVPDGRAGGIWDITDSWDSQCADTWYSLKDKVILCFYN